MTGPEHFAQAEKIIAQVENRDVSAAEVAAYAKVAQVHAMLAVAAATAMGNPGGLTTWDAQVRRAEQKGSGR